MTFTWIDSPSHQHWLTQHANGLLAFGRNVGRPGGGAVWLDDNGQPDESKGLQTWITARMVHVFGLGALMGVPGSGAVAEVAMAGLIGPLRDEVNGGWFSAIDANGPTAGKACYDHVFLLIAGATGTHAGLSGAPELLVEAEKVFLQHFWDDATGGCFDTWNTSFTELEPYRGINANMHAVEAMLSVASLTGDHVWLERAERICRRVISMSEPNGWRIPEHFDLDWAPQLDYNIDRPADQFKPYGATVGHAFEWSRLFLHLANSPLVTARESLVKAAEYLYERAVLDGWARDGAPGFVYTTDWNGEPVVRDRLHWVLTEAINTSAALLRQTGNTAYEVDYRKWWDHAARFHIDPANGSWIHQLDHDNKPAQSVWTGRPDLYHALQAAIVPTMPLYPMVAAALAG
jgi:sulfoquinovose isomerase